MQRRPSRIAILLLPNIFPKSIVPTPILAIDTSAIYLIEERLQLLKILLQLWIQSFRKNKLDSRYFRLGECIHNFQLMALITAG